jgi:hypothetical protein
VRSWLDAALAAQPKADPVEIGHVDTAISALVEYAKAQQILTHANPATTDVLRGQAVTGEKFARTVWNFLIPLFLDRVEGYWDS